MNALNKASIDAERMHAAAAYAVKQATSPTAIAGIVGAGQPGQQRRPAMGNAEEQYRHFTSWVFAAIRPIAQKIAGQTIHVGRVATRMPGRRGQFLKSSLPNCFKSMGESLEPLDDHEILSVLADPNDLNVAWSLIYTTIVSLELTGQAFWWLPNRSTILPIPAHWVRGHHGTTRYEAWEVAAPGMAEPKSIPADEMVYFHYPHPSDPKAVFSPLQAAAMAVTTDEAIQDSQRLAFQRGIMPKVVLNAGRLEGMVSGPGQRPVLTAPQRAQLIDAIKRVYRGYSKWDEPFIVDGLIEGVETLGRTIAEMDFLQSGQQTKSRIFQVFGTNPIIAGEIEGANRASATVAESQFCSGTVNPKTELLSQVLTKWFAPRFARNGERLVIWIEPCRASDPEQRLKEWSLAMSKGVVSANEYRTRILNLEAHPDGDELLLSRQQPPPAAALPPPPEPAKAIDPYTLKRLANSNGSRK